jgi:hypothetical protein
MLKVPHSRSLVLLALCVAHFACIEDARAQSNDPDPGHGAPKATSGLGESNPSASDLATDPDWQVYGFERDGIRYYQVNDNTGTVRTAVGTIGGTFWTLPIGTDADRVLLTGATAPSCTRKTLYVGNDVRIDLCQTSSSGNYWIVENISTTY